MQNPANNPSNIGAQIVESGAKLCTKEELEQYCKNALGSSAQSGQ